MPPTFESNYRMSEQELERLLRPSLGPDGNNLSNIARFYDGRSVLVTGATGFVGRLIVEKLLRACTKIRRVYVLVRQKNGKTTRERIKDLTESLVFDGLRYMGINLEDKLVPVEGDLTKECYGFSAEHLSVLAEEVSMIFHSAASVNFQEPLLNATQTNLIGALNAIRLAKQLPKLEALVYVSTAYSNCVQQLEVGERIYEPLIDPMIMVQMANILERDTMEAIKQHMLGPFPNTYTFTKNLAEFLCSQHASELPIVVCRPSVVVSTWREPIEGFVDNINGGNGVNYGPASGLSVILQADNSVLFDYVPVDVVVNCVIALGWFCAKYFESRQMKFALANATELGNERAQLTQKMKHFHERKLAEFRQLGLAENLVDLPVFNATSGAENPIKFGKFKDKMIAYANKYPTLQLYRFPRMTYVRSRHAFKIGRFLQNTLAAKFFDFIYHFDRLKPEIYDKSDPIAKRSLAFRSERIDHFGQTITYFLTNHWDFRNENRLMLIDHFMNDEDKRLFGCDMRQLDWDEYCKIYALGIRKFLLKEPITTLDRARSHMKLIRIRDSCIQLLLILAVVFFFFVTLF